MTTATPTALMPRVRWAWLWGSRDDLVWNFAPFWLGFVVVAVLFAARNLGAAATNPMLNFNVASTQVHVMTWVMFLYGPLVDAPHLWATIARTYVDKDEWAARRRLFLGSLVWFLIGPAVILLPYALHAIVALPAGSEAIGWIAWSNFFTFYALFHINKQHWGFIALYKRKNADMADARENRADSWFFHSAIWLPYAAMLTAPWYVDVSGKPLPGTQIAVAGTTVGALLQGACHVVFFAVCAAYAIFQFLQWQKGAPRNGPKLAYIATVIPLYYLAFCIHPLVAAFWVLITGVGHCAQYHRVVWAYGQTKYAGKPAAERRLPSSIFENVWLYVVLGLAFGFVTLQGPGSGTVQRVMAGFEAGFFRHAFSFLDNNGALSLGGQVTAAFVSGVRLHHFYVDSKIWRVSKSAALAKNLNVAS